MSLHSTRHTRFLRYAIAFAIIFVLIVGTCVSLLATHAASSTCANPTDTAYRVVAGDTLSSIATAHGTTSEVLASHNTLANPNLIFPFQLICIASRGTVSVPMPGLPNSPFVATARLDAAAAGVPVQIFVNQINQESGFNPGAVSPAGAIGIAQFLPSTAAGLGIDPHDPNQSLRGAAELMASYLNTYNGNIDMALAAYNAGPGTVNGAVARCGATNFRSCLAQMTQDYIHAITGN